MEEIDERIRLKAINAPASKDKHRQPAPSPDTKAGPLGSGISEEDVDRIMKEFSKR